MHLRPHVMEGFGKRKAVIDRKALEPALLDALEKTPGAQRRALLLKRLKEAYDAGLGNIEHRLDENRMNGLQAAAALAYLSDQIIRILYTATVRRFYPAGSTQADEKLAILATGGYGRGQLAPFSDLDLMILLPAGATPWTEQVAEFMLYLLWDMGLRVGHAVRTAGQAREAAKADLKTRTALLDARYIWGEQALFAEFLKGLEADIKASGGVEFVEAKLAERDARHRRLGDSRYVVEPNLKEGKGGLRDLQTLYWIARYLYGVGGIGELRDLGVISAGEARLFHKTENFIWATRFQLHFLAGRAEERLTFDVQRELAERMHYKGRPGVSAVERFMKHYYLMAKEVGNLTRVFCASLEAQEKKKQPASGESGTRDFAVDGYALEGGRLTVDGPDRFRDDPVSLIEIFHVADRHGLELHPDALRLIQQNLKRIDADLRKDERANALFMKILTSRHDPENALRRMNEAGVFGRFIPDFGRVVAQTQHDMYHHYTVDEHTIRAIGLLSRLEKGEFEDEIPLISKAAQQVDSRRALYVAVLLHDIAKGRGGDHSKIGADIAMRLGPRLGLKQPQITLVSWLVLRHLLMSNFAFKRDLSDPKTIENFVKDVKSPERLRMLAALTVVDIRAVGPGIWNSWKGQLLTDLFRLAEERLVAGHMGAGRKQHVTDRKKQLAESLSNWSAAEKQSYFERFSDSYWIAEEPDMHLRNARLVRRTEKAGETTGIGVHVERDQDVTRISIYTPNQRGLFNRLAGALALIGAHVVDAKIFTTRDEMALDNFLVQDAQGRAFDDPERLRRIGGIIREGLASRGRLEAELLARKRPASRTDIFTVEPLVLFDNNAGSRQTVVEIDARDRTGLLFDISRVFYEQKVAISSAHIATYGERAVDVFYVQELDGRKITNGNRIRSLKEKLADAARDPESRALSLTVEADDRRTGTG